MALKDAFANFANSMAVSIPILDAGVGTLISDKQRILQRWQEHFDQLLKRPPATISAELLQAPAVAVDNPDIFSSTPMEDEIKSALKKLMNCCCNIAPDRVILVGRTTTGLPEDWKKEIILPLYKGKGSKQDCKNYIDIIVDVQFNKPLI